MSSSDNNPFLGFFTGMMNQFMRDPMANGSLPAALAASTLPATSSPAPLPTLSVPPALQYTSARAQPIALPAAPAGHPLPSNNLCGYNTTQPMLGMGGLGIPVSGHSNNPRRRRRRVDDLSPTQIFETNNTRRAAAREHLGPASAALQLRNRRVRGPAVRGAVLNETPGTTLEQVSSVDVAGVRQVKMTVMVQAFQPGQEVTYYKNYASAFGQFARDSHLLFEYTVAETTKVTTLLEMSMASMRTGPRRYTFGSLPAGPSTRLQHEQLHLQALAFVNCAKLRGAGSANLRRAPEVNATVTVQDLFYPPWKNLFAVPTLCVQNGRFVLNCIIRYGGASFLEESPNHSLSLRHHCLTARQKRQFTEAVEMNFHDSDSDDNASDTSGGIPTDPDDDDDMPAAPTLTAATVPSSSRAAHTSDLQTLSSTAALMVPSQSQQPNNSLASSSVLPSQPVNSVTPRPAAHTHPTQPATLVAPPWGTSSFTQAPSGPYDDLFNRPDVAAAVYQTVGGVGRLDLEADSLQALAKLYIECVRVASENGDFTPLLCPRRKFKVLDPHNPSVGAGLERETIYTALNIFLSNTGQWCVPTDEDRLSLGISMPQRLASAIAPSRLADLRVLGALVSLSLISGKPPGALTPALLQYALNDRDLGSLTPGFVDVWHPKVARVARAMQAVGPLGSLLPFQSEIISHLNVQISALGQRNENQHNNLVRELVHNAIMGPEVHGHLETDFFCSGVELQCAGGFSFVKFARSYPGGTEFYIANSWTSHISDYRSLEPLLIISQPDPHDLLSTFGPPIPMALDAEALFTNFLQRVGTPCPALLEAAKPHFDAAVLHELLNINLPSFRPRMFCWATTGSPFLEPDPDANAHDPIVVHFVLPGDAFYSDNPTSSASNMGQGANLVPHLFTMCSDPHVDAA
ncbi:hypothetical protein MVEN_00101500 [Mycena venus]|uniref:HECT domain-containing protein n=1 Tax=Mycena venus TaxID=2733690 RepID=A0A8H6Z7H0_9AGAR|nr:hypothetical protein MVEN_00101500 [Mycena venus]